MNFGTILTGKMKKTVVTSRLGCGVSRVLDGAEAWRLFGLLLLPFTFTYVSNPLWHAI